MWTSEPVPDREQGDTKGLAVEAVVSDEIISRFENEGGKIQMLPVYPKELPVSE